MRLCGGLPAQASGVFGSYPVSHARARCRDEAPSARRRPAHPSIFVNAFSDGLPTQATEKPRANHSSRNCECIPIPALARALMIVTSCPVKGASRGHSEVGQSESWPSGSWRKPLLVPEARSQGQRNRRGGTLRGVAVCLCFPAIREASRGRYKVRLSASRHPSLGGETKAKLGLTGVARMRKLGCLKFSQEFSCPGRDAARSSCEALLRRTGIVPNAALCYGPGSAAHRYARATRCAASGERAASDGLRSSPAMTSD
jgi:hypothetical protein